MEGPTTSPETPVSPVNTGTPPPNYLVWAILTTIFCCLPFGIVSIIFAAQVNSKWQAGDMDGAMQASKSAKTWAWVAGGVGIAVAVIYIALMALGIGTAIFGNLFGS